jgi:CubicO group peptidase (beta-lactamase class C family)
MNRLFRFLLSIVWIVAATAAARADEIDDYVKAALDQHHIPGASLAIVQDGALIKATSYGLANVENNAPASPETVFKIGSVSKQFVATGIMLLVQDRKIDLNDKVSKYLEATPSAWEQISIRHLLTHTSGLEREAPGFDPHKIQPDIDVIKTAYQLPLRFKPGEKWEYCNLGYFILAQIIQTVTGKPFDAFLQEQIFAPLGMSATRVTTVAGIVPNRAGGYAWNAGALRNEENWLAARPSGAFLSTVLDLAKWEAALMAGDVLKGPTKTQMWTPVTLNDGRPYPYGFGWQLNDWPADAPPPTGVPMIRHGGSMPGFRAGYFRWPSYRLAVVLLTNLSGAPIDVLGANIAIRYLPELKPAPRPTQAPPK